MVSADKLYSLSLAEATGLVRRHEVSPVELTEAVLHRIEQVDGRTQAYVTVLADSALEAARVAERAIAAGGYLGPLHGIPIALKDICDLAGVPTTCSSKVREGHVAGRDATVAARLRQAGAVIVGKTVTHEFAYGVVGLPTRNAWDLDRIPGGSSSGSAVAVAAGECFGAIGSDTGGSIRIPSALNGVVGLKPTYGRVSKWGVMPLSWSLDHVGPIVRRVADAALLLNALAGYDPRDPTTAPEPVPDYTAGLDAGVRGLRLGLPRNYYFEGIDPDVERAVHAAIEVLRGQGAEIVEVSIPAIEHAWATGAAILWSEASSVHQPILRRQATDYTDATRLRLEAGELVLATHYLKAQRARTVIKRGFRTALAEVDAILAPTLPATAAHPDALTVELGGQPIDVRLAYTRWAYPANVSGLPALSVPCGFSRDNLPIGLQIIGRPFAEATILRIAHAYEAGTDWHTRRPPL